MRLPALLIICLGAVSDLSSQELGGPPFTGMIMLTDTATARVSSFDQSGANTDFRPIAAGETLELARLDGAGIVRHVYFSILGGPHYLRDLVLRAYWDGQETPCDRQLAIRTFNDLVRLRFTQLEGYSLLTDSRHRRVDGLLSRRYQRLSNYDLYVRSHRFIRSKQPGMKFHEAACCGRRMMLRYCDSRLLFQAEAPPVKGQPQLDPFVRGFHFANSEVGECALRISTRRRSRSKSTV